MKLRGEVDEDSRPDLVIVDDPQTNESARSLTQVVARERVLAGAVLRLAGPDSKIAGFCPCKVIAPDDLADRILDRQKHPEWQGERTKLLKTFPTNKRLWEEYAQIRARGLRAGRGLADATAFYIANRPAMDEGAKAAWPERFNPDEASAVQYAMNLFLQDEEAFWSEYQNAPLVTAAVADELTVDQIAAKISRRPQGEVPGDAAHLTAFIDVQQNLLYWAAAAWETNFTGTVLDYGAYPDQLRPHFTAAAAQRTLLLAHPSGGLEAAIYAGLDTLVGELLGRVWTREDGAEMRIGRLLIDANWGQSTKIVYEFCRATPFAAIVRPSHGRYVGASSPPFDDYKPKPGDQVGSNWRIPAAAGKKVRHLLFDTNAWKSFIHARLASPIGDLGCLTLFGDEPERHRMFAEHLSAEYRVRTEGRGRQVDEWKIRPERPDNHWFDCLVGSALGASIEGCQMVGAAAPPPRERKSIVISGGVATAVVKQIPQTRERRRYVL